MREGIKLALTLMIICAVAGISLSFVNNLTHDRIVEQQEEGLARSLKVALPAAKYEKVGQASLKEDPQFESVEAIWRAGEPSGLVVQVAPVGYNGNIICLVGLDSNGTIRGVAVNQHTETPGLGARVVEDSFLQQFQGKGERQAVVKDGGQIQAISGATISSRALTAGVNTALAVFEEVWR
jgi:electron transport complex protein RnfG